jgi:hypothetical protein
LPMTSRSREEIEFGYHSSMGYEINDSVCTTPPN